jgi:hypothetical protein
MHQTLHLINREVIAFIDTSRCEHACFDLIVHGAATYTKHRHHVICIHLFGGKIANRILQAVNFSLQICEHRFHLDKLLLEQFVSAILVVITFIGNCNKIIFSKK